MADLKVKDLRLRLGDNEILKGVSLSVTPGQVVALLGPSGSGKTTLLRAVAGLDRATSGTVTLDDISISAPHAKIGIIFQEPRLLPWLSVADNIGFGLSDAPANIRREKVARALKRVGLADKADAWPRELSGGMKMRVSIARALVTEPRLLLMDEPFAALDEITRHRLNADLLELWQRSTVTVVFVTHSVFESVFLSQHIAVMAARPGRVLSELSIAAPYPRSESFRTSAEYAAYCRQASAQLGEAMAA